jgi:hypothetical protein
MKTPATINSIEQRDAVLEELYLNRNFYCFLFGELKFNSTVEEVFAKYLAPLQAAGNDLVIERVAWEYDNGYIDESI